MKATLSLLTLITFIIGFAFVGSAIAQDDAGSTSAEESPVPEADTADTLANDATEEAKNKVPENAIDQGKGLYTSVKGAEWLLAFGFLGMLLGSLGRWATAKKWNFIKTKAGGYTIAGFTGLGILGGLIVEAGAFSTSMLPTAITGMLAAMALHGPAKAAKDKLQGTSKA